jgi:transcriptional regulator with XRE-family HTH domain
MLNNEEQNHFPNCLRKYRKARDLSQKDVARILGLNSSSVISRWENGACLPNTTNVFKLAALYRVFAETLFVDLNRELRAELIEKEKRLLEKQKVEVNK